MSRIIVDSHHPLRLLIVGLRWPPETFLVRLIEGLLEAGVHITAATSQKPSQKWLAHDQFNWLWLPAWRGPKFLRLIRLSYFLLSELLQSPRQLYRIYQQISPQPWAVWNRLLPLLRFQGDVIYIPWTSTMAALTYLGCPVVISCRGSQINVYPHDPNYRGYRDQLPQIFSRATAVHCVTDAIKREAAKYGLDPQKAAVIRPAVDPDFFCPPTAPRQPAPPFHIVSVGSLTWLKGYEYALLALRQLVNEQLPVCLHIIGDGPDRQRILYTIEDLGLQEVVQLKGQLTPEQVRNELHQAHIFLLSSLSEGIANAALEAMACCLPVVTTACGGMDEAITNGVEGFIVPILDEQAMAEALKRLIADAQLREKMGQAGRQTICQRFTLAQQVQSFFSLFQSCLEV